MAISPSLVAGLILVLLTPKGRTNGVAFAIGWVAAISVVGFGALLSPAREAVALAGFMIVASLESEHHLD